MKHSSRKVIHRSHWNNHLIEVIDSGDERSLYFAGNVLQSGMSLYAPHALVLSYTQYMMATLLMNDVPQRILVVGIGAGSLIRFLHHHFPEALIDGIDSSQPVIDLAKEFFNLPENSCVNIHCGDGQDFLTNRTTEYNYDLILIDAFDALGMSETIYHSGFIELCLHHLNISGIMSLNLWSGDDQRMERVIGDVSAHCESCVQLPVPNRGNVICLAGRGQILSTIMDQDSIHLAQLKARFGINFKAILNVCRKHNMGLFQRISRLFS